NRRVGPRRQSDRPISMRRGLPIGSTRPRLRHPERLGAQPGQRGRRAIPRLGGLPRPPLDCPGQSWRDVFPGRKDNSVRQRNDLAARPGGAAASAASAPVNAARAAIFDHAGVSGHIDWRPASALKEQRPCVYTRKRPAMTDDLRRQPSAGRIALLKLAVVAVIAGAALVAACSEPSDSQQPGAQQQQQQAAGEQARKEADEKAWADAEKTGTVAAYTAYLQNFGAGAHVSEASQRIVALNEQARKAADEKAWADAEKAGTAAAYTAYIQNFGGGAHAAQARQRV